VGRDSIPASLVDLRAPLGRENLERWQQFAWMTLARQVGDLPPHGAKVAEIKGQEHVKLYAEESWLQCPQKSVLPITKIPPKNPIQIEFAR
jgi:hypothetical protein